MTTKPAPPPALPPASPPTLLPALLLAFLLTLPGCLIYRIDVQQGNEITVQMLDRLQLGMSRREVGKTLGFPLLIDPFHVNRWDYYFYRKRGNSSEIEQHSATLRFADDALVRVESSLFEN